MENRFVLLRLDRTEILHPTHITTRPANSLTFGSVVGSSGRRTYAKGPSRAGVVQGNPAVGRTDGGGEPYLGLYTDSGAPSSMSGIVSGVRPSLASLGRRASRQCRSGRRRGGRSCEHIRARSWARISSSTEVWTWRGLVMCYTVFVIDLASRRVHLVGSTAHPDELFMRHVGRATSAGSSNRAA
jgi:hypothetical protein